MPEHTNYISKEEFFLFQQGNEKVFDAIFQLHYKPLVFFANKLVKEKAEDIVIESFAKLWNKKARIEKAGAIKNYLYTSVRNGCLNFLRNEKVKCENEKVLPLYTDWEEPVLHHIIRADTINEILRSMELLPAQCRLVFKKFFVEGKDYPTIAREMKLSISTVRNQKARALLLLRGRLLPVFIPIFFACRFFVIL
jgi:RNA polymerase sigma-70 factor (ECF subfamily)